MRKSRKNIKDITIAGVSLALAVLLPFVTGQIQSIGNMLCPMHIPVLLCAFFVGWQWATLVGFVAPLLRFVLFSMPPMPLGLSMALELAVYGFVASTMYRVLPKRKSTIYISLVCAMVLGRVVWGIARMVIAGVTATTFTWQMFLAGALLEAIPGIIIQLILIPIIVMTVEKNSENY